MSATRRAVAIAVAAGGAVALLAIVGWPASAYRHGAADMPQFHHAARTLLEGRTPYAVWDWPYPLWTAVALLPIGLLPLELAAPVWLVGQLVAVGAALVALARHVLVTDPRRDRLLLFAIAAAMQPTWLLVGGGNMTGLLFAAFTGALVAQLTGRPLVAGSLVGLLVTKPQSLAVAAAALFAGSPPASRARLAIAAVAVAGTLVAGAFALHLDWVGAWAANAAALQASSGSNATGWTLGRTVAALVPTWLGSAAGLIAVGAAFVAWWWRRRPGLALLVAAAVPVSLFVAPHGWSYDQLHLLVTYAVALELIAHTGRERIAWLATLLIIACVLPWLLYASAVATGGEAATAAVPLLAFALLVLLDARGVRSATSR